MLQEAESGIALGSRVRDLGAWFVARFFGAGAGRLDGEGI